MAVFTKIKRAILSNRIVQALTSRSISDIMVIMEKREETNLESRLRKLYENDGLTFQLVNYLTDKICGQGFYFEGDPDLVDRAEAWAESIGLEFVIRHLVKNAIIFGTSYCELVPGKNGIDRIVVYDPLKVEPLKDNMGRIIIEEGKPKGIKIEIDEKITVTVTKDRVEDNRGEIILKAAKGEDLRDRFPSFMLESYGSEPVGISLMKPAYRSAIIRCNIADMVGESASRGGGILAYYSGTPPAEKVKDFLQTLKNLTPNDALALSDKWRVDTVPIPDIRERIEQIRYLADEEAASFGIPLDVLMCTVKSYASDLPAKLADFEIRVQAYQRYLAYQVDTKILGFLKRQWRVEDKDLRIVFRSSFTATRLQNARIRATLARRTLLRWDPELELKIRKEEGLPYSFVLRQLEEWKGSKRPPEEGREVDVYEE